MLFYYIIFISRPFYAVFYYDYEILLHVFRFVYLMLQILLGYVIALRIPR